MVSSANQFSKKFQKQFDLPRVLGLNDEPHQKIRQIAPALESLAISVQLTREPEAIAYFVPETVQA